MFYANFNKYPGLKIPFYKIKYRNPQKHKPGKNLVDQEFIWHFFGGDSNMHYEKFKLGVFMPIA